jgi:hypothetical protein
MPPRFDEIFGIGAHLAYCSASVSPRRSGDFDEREQDVRTAENV